MHDSGKKIAFNNNGDLRFILEDKEEDEGHINSLSSGEIQLVVILTHLYFNPEVDRSEIPSCVLLSLYFNKLIFIHLTILSFDNCAPNTAQWLARRRSTPSLSD